MTDMMQIGAYRENSSKLIGFSRGATALLVLILIIVPFDPFSDLSEPFLSSAWEGGDVINQASYTLMGFLTLSMIPIVRFRSFLTGFGVLAVLMFAWLGLSALASQDPDLSIRRVAFTLVVCLTAAGWMFLPQDVSQLSRILSLFAGTVLVLCYCGILLVPSHAIHQSADFLEPGLAGDWRGVFGHKNEAGAVMALLVFIGIFIIRTSGVLVGSPILIGAAAFLIGSEAKTSLILLPLVLGISYLALHSASLTRLLFCCLAPLVLFNVFGVFAVYSDAAQTILNLAISDASFTGRTDVWQFAISNVLQRPVLGHGFMAFWRTDQLLSETPSPDLWANTAAHSHNGYLDMTLTTGFPGLVLCILFVVIGPILAYDRYRRSHAPDGLSLLLLQIWLFGIYFNCFESALFDRGNRVWFFLCSAVFGLYYISRLQLLIGPPPCEDPVRNRSRIRA